MDYEFSVDLNDLHKIFSMIDGSSSNRKVMVCADIHLSNNNLLLIASPENIERINRALYPTGEGIDGKKEEKVSEKD